MLGYRKFVLLGWLSGARPTLLKSLHTSVGGSPNM